VYAAKQDTDASRSQLVRILADELQAKRQERALLWLMAMNARICFLLVATSCTGEIGSVGDGAHEPPRGTVPDAVDCSDPPEHDVGRLRRLTRAELANSMNDIFGEDGDVMDRLPREPQVEFMYNSYEDLWFDTTFARGYLEASAEVASSAASRLESFFPCPWSERVDGCVRELVTSMGARLFRKPLGEESVERYVTLFESLDSDDSVNDRVATVLEAMLVSPDFLYRDETSRDGDVDESFRIASQLSYLIWASTPDEALLEQATLGRLVEPRVLRDQVERMLEHSFASRGFSQFIEYLFDVPRFREIQKNEFIYPDFDDELIDEMVEEIRALASSTFETEGGSLTDLMTANSWSAGPRLAELYGARRDSDGIVELDPGQRSGLLTTAGVLSFTSLPDKTRPVGRGYFVLSRLLCRELEIPPEAEIGLPEEGPDTEGLSVRERFALHIEREECAGCHQHIDPLGFGMENYDAIGRWRTHDDGLPIDATGTLVGTGTADGPFEGGVELAHRLAESRVFQDCFAERYVQYAMGRAVADRDVCGLGEVQENFIESNLSLRDLVMAVAVSDSFVKRSRAEEE
jgi:hypothetical protein